MAKSKQQKEQQVQHISELVAKKGVIFFNYHGLSVSALDELRSKLREADAKLIVAKKTLLKIALTNKELPFGGEANGPIAVAVADDEVTPAKVVSDFKKTNDQVEFYGGLLENTFIDVQQVKNLADLPSKPELQAKVVGSLQAPISGFVNVLAGNMRGLVNVLNAVKEQKA